MNGGVKVPLYVKYRAKQKLNIREFNYKFINMCMYTYIHTYANVYIYQNDLPEHSKITTVSI